LGFVSNFEFRASNLESRVSPRHQLIVSVGIIAAVIAIAWFMLFQRNVLAPPVTMPAGPTLPEIGKEFDASLEQFNKLLPTAVNGAPTANVPATNAPVNVAPVNAAPAPPVVSDDAQIPTLERK
jgi:hypothetical protein